MAELPDPRGFALSQGRGGPPPGFTFGWRDDSEFSSRWRPVEGDKQCRYDSTSSTSPRCEAKAVAELDRSSNPNKPRWWAYCEDHLFGRLWHEGRIYSIVLVEVAAT